MPLKMQALVNLFLSASGLVVLGTLYLSPSLLMSAAHELCTFAMRSDSLASLSRTPDDSYSIPSSAGHSLGDYLWPTHLMGQTCGERASYMDSQTLLETLTHPRCLTGAASLCRWPFPNATLSKTAHLNGSFSDLAA